MQLSSKRRTKSTLHRNMYVVHCAVDCTASIAGGLISFDIDASLIYTVAASSVRWIGGFAGTRCRGNETAGSVSGSSDCAGESHRPVRVLAAVYRWDILVS